MKVEVTDDLILFINVCKEVWNKRGDYAEFDYPEYMGISQERMDSLGMDEVDAIQYCFNSINDYNQEKFVNECLDFVSNGMSTIWFGGKIKIYK